MNLWHTLFSVFQRHKKTYDVTVFVYLNFKDGRFSAEK